MTRHLIGLLVTCALGFLVIPLAAEAQPPVKGPRISILTPATEASTPVFEAFRQGLHELGYVEGQNIVLEFRLAAGRLDRLRDLAAELVQRQVDVILTDSAAAAQAAKHATTTIPIVMATGGDPVQSGLVASLARPGGNLTGLTLLARELNGKRLELLKEAVPGVTHVAVLWNPTSLAAMGDLSEADAAAQALHLQLHALEVPGPEAIETAFAAATKGQADALITLADAMLWNQRTKVADLAAQHRLPALFPEREFVDAGGLLSYGPSVPANFHRAATFVDRILKGAKPGDLPIERPMKFELVINLKTAQALGLTIPPTLLFQANEVIR
jgi:putative tryptophan/tyrosine transport system substrate-binding protein